MTEENDQLASLFAACWKDEALKQRFMSDPKAVLAEYGIDVPANIDVNVVENSDNTVHITMPQVPAGAADLSIEELTKVAGGDTTSGVTNTKEDMSVRSMPLFGKAIEL
jgi:nitrile hydratase